VIVDLDAEASLDPTRVGSKAASLAVGRRVGLPVLPGFVVEASASRDHMELGAATLATRGSGGARLSIMQQPLPFADALVTAGTDLAATLVARSSTELERGGEWSGAFTSYLGLAAGELPRAVVGCWASAFSVAALELQHAASIAAGSFEMAVLVQPNLQPEAGGTARLRSDGTIVVHGVKGSPAPMLQGWSSGHEAVLADTWQGEDLIALVGVEVLAEVAEHMRRANVALGVNRCEWALDGELWLLQLATAHHQAAAPVTTPVDIDDPGLIPIARAAARVPGKLGQDLVLPWALAGLPPHRPPTAEDAGSPLTPGSARELRDQLLSEVWGLPVEEALAAAHECISLLLGREPGLALDRVATLRPPDPDLACRLLAHCDQSLRPSHSSRLGVGRWEPFIASTTIAFGTHHQGSPAAPGLGAGPSARIDHPLTFESYRPRSIVTAPQPLPHLAPLLWDAPGLVTETGSPAAHLFESARALGIPAVCGVDLPCEELMVAVDGYNGTVATLPLNGGDYD
jgi:hypothetical protein